MPDNRWRSEQEARGAIHDGLAIQPVLICVSGLPCTGKSTLARRLANEFSIPMFSKDEFKESLFDALGWSDRDWSRRVGLASIHLLFKVADAELKARRSVILENNFVPLFDRARFLELRNAHRVRMLEIHCTGNRQLLVDRFIQRARSGDRHPGHRENDDAVLFAELAPAIESAQDEPLAVADALITSFCDRPEDENWASVLSEARSFIESARA